MSRTYRTKLLYYKKVHGEFYTCGEDRRSVRKYHDDLETLQEELLTANRPWYCNPFKGAEFIYNKCRDKKAWNKPPKWFKQMHRQQERAQSKEALYRLGNDPDSDKVIPRFPKGDQWDWT